MFTGTAALLAAGAVREATDPTQIASETLMGAVAPALLFAGLGGFTLTLSSTPRIAPLLVGGGAAVGAGLLAAALDE